MLWRIITDNYDASLNEVQDILDFGLAVIWFRATHWIKFDRWVCIFSRNKCNLCWPDRWRIVECFLLKHTGKIKRDGRQDLPFKRPQPPKPTSNPQTFLLVQTNILTLCHSRVNRFWHIVILHKNIHESPENTKGHKIVWFASTSNH